SDSSTSSSDPPDVRRAGWWSAVLGCTLVLVTGLSAIYLARGVLETAALKDPVCNADHKLTDRVRAWRARPQSADVVRTVLFGDSVTLKPNLDQALGPALGFALSARSIPNDVLEVTFPGLSAFQFYYRLEGVLAGRPGLAVVEVNLRTFAD